MALCRDCRTVIPCHCHLAPAVQVRPGVYEATEPHPCIKPPQTPDCATEK
jgi:hypothetical protein